MKEIHTLADIHVGAVCVEVKAGKDAFYTIINIAGNRITIRWHNDSEETGVGPLRVFETFTFPALKSDFILTDSEFNDWVLSGATEEEGVICKQVDRG